MKKLLLGGALAAMTLAVFLVPSEETTAAEATNEDLARQLGELAAQLESTQRELATVKRDQSRQQATPQAAAAPGTQEAPPADRESDQAESADDEAANDDDDEQSWEERLAKERRNFGVYFGTLDKLRTAEGRDDAWSGNAETAITETLAGEDYSGSKLDRVECGATLCRVEVRHDNEMARAHFVGTFMRAIATLVDQGSVLSQIGSNESVGYFARNGNRLPPYRAVE